MTDRTATGYEFATQGRVAKTNMLALISLITGILWLYWIGSIIAIVTGLVALHQINQAPGYQQGRGMAIAGIALGAVGASIYITLVIAFH